MLLGIGYLPRRTGPALWRDFDAAEIKDDLAHVAELGFQAVRVPLFWSDFQPAQERIYARSLDCFGAFLEIAHAQGLKVAAGLWTGIWDGALWWPDWGVTPAPLPPHWPLLVEQRWVQWGRIRHPFTNARMLEARSLLARELAGFYAAHPALIGWEPLPGFGRLAAGSDRAAALDWLGSSIEMLAEAAPDRACTFLLALDALETKTPVWPGDIMAVGGQPSLSIATFASDRRRLPLSPWWIAFGIDLAALLAGAPMGVHLAGLPTAGDGEPSRAEGGVYYAAEEEAAAHLADVIAIARRRKCPELWLWRWADTPEDLWQQPPYDHPNWRRHTGLLRADGQEKKLTAALREAGGASDYPVFECDADEYRQDPAANFARFWRSYRLEGEA